MHRGTRTIRRRALPKVGEHEHRPPSMRQYPVGPIPRRGRAWAVRGGVRACWRCEPYAPRGDTLKAHATAQAAEARRSHRSPSRRTCGGPSLPPMPPKLSKPPRPPEPPKSSPQDRSCYLAPKPPKQPPTPSRALSRCPTRPSSNRSGQQPPCDVDSEFTDKTAAQQDLRRRLADNLPAFNRRVSRTVSYAREVKRQLVDD